jgi:hypothetical protein
MRATMKHVDVGALFAMGGNAYAFVSRPCRCTRVAVPVHLVPVRSRC